MPRLMTVKEVAGALGYCEDTIWKWIRDGKLEATKLPTGRIRVSEETVKRLFVAPNKQTTIR